MANIRVDVEYTIKDGSEVSFTAPCDCTSTTGLKVYHQGGSKEFVFTDAHGHVLTGIGELFAAGAFVKVILDVTNGYAYIQNADTNAYLEAQLASKAPADSVGTNKVFKKLTDIGITTFPTTMSIVASKMPNNSTLIIDSRDIVSGGANEISDLGAAGAGTYMIMRGNTTSRLQLLHIYGAATAETSFVEVGNYAVTPNTVTWVRALDNADATYATASANNNYHTAYFTKIGRFVSCTLLPKTTNTTAVYQEDITIPSGYAPSANTTFSIYSDTSKNAGGNGSASVIAYKNGVLRVSSNAGISLAEASKTYCWVTA